MLHPCAYFSKKLSLAEQNYDIGNRELLTIKLSLEVWRHWLEGAKHPFEVITDHKILQYLRETKRLNSRQASWSLFFTCFNFSLTYTWPHMHRDVKRYIQGCSLCAMSSTPRNLPEGKLVPLPIPSRPWSHIGIDFATDLPSSNGYTMILVVVDRFSKACKLIPLKGLPTALKTAEVLFH